MIPTAIAPAPVRTFPALSMPSATGVRPAVAQAPLCPPPYPSPPCDGLDMSNIDTPYKAALLPSLNGSILSMLYGALNPGQSMIAADFTMQLGSCGAPTQIHYDMNNGAPMRATGTLAGQVFNESWMPSADGGYDVVGQIGTAQEHLHVHADFNFWYMDETAGNVEVHERGFVVNGPTAGSRYVLDGCAAGQLYHTELYPFENGFTTYGYLSNVGAASNFTVTPSPDGSSMAVQGSGVQAGTTFALQGTLSLTPPAAAPPPPPPPTWAPPVPAGGATADLAHWRQNHDMLTDAERKAQK